MYLSRLQLNPLHLSARRDLGSAYEMHRTLTRVFADGPASTPARFLWRLEPDGCAGREATVLVQAAMPGQWDLLRNEAGYLDRLDADKHVSLDRLLHPARRYRFRLLANPTVTRDGKRYGLHGDEALLAWLGRQALRGGFSLHGAACSARGRLGVAQGRGGRRITIDTALFEGVLEAVETARLEQCLRSGIGPGKALGMGLLSIAPIRRDEGDAHPNTAVLPVPA